MLISTCTRGEQPFGIVARDKDGFVLTGRALVLEGRHTPETIVAYTFQEGVKLALDNGWRQVTLEGDAIGIVHRLANPGLDLSTPAAILNDKSLHMRWCPQDRSGANIIKLFQINSPLPVHTKTQVLSIVLQL
ncbi:hypothetical protein V6N13_089032 [Hibiscus sabdariffa]